MITTDQARDIIKTCYQWAGNSLDPSTQNAAVVVDVGSAEVLQGTYAVNNFPSGVAHHPERWERPDKYMYVEHAERAAIYRAAALGHKTYGRALVCPWAACTDCARGIIGAGIVLLVRHHVTDTSHWDDNIQVADTMLHEAGIQIIDLYGPVRAGVEILRNGELIAV